MLDLEQIIAGYSFKIITVATILLVIFAAISLKLKRPKEKIKKTLFISILITVIIPTLFLSIPTIYINIISSSQGPVHWHADLEIWSCGKEINLKDPTGFSNKIGTSTLHEHNDKRIHLEGVVIQPEDASLEKFFRVIGGTITPALLTVPTNTGLLSFQSGSFCDNGQTAELQVFVYQPDKENYYSQQKLTNPQEYIISPYSNVPTGDCIIIEFDTPKFKTDKLCRSYRVAEEIGKLKGERKYGY